MINVKLKKKIYKMGSRLGLNSTKVTNFKEDSNLTWRKIIFQEILCHHKINQSIILISGKIHHADYNGE